jgi:glycosyltransferase involved in cell wall biosynthesis
MLEFSVVIPLYNRDTYIRRAVDSVLSQTVKTFELIVVDDGSTDRSAQIVKEYSDRRIRIVKQQNSGVSAARNRGISEAKADYIAFLDADDEWKPDFLETISQLIKEYPDAGTYCTALEKIGLNGKPMKRVIDGIPSGDWHGIIPNYLKSASSMSVSPTHSSALCVPKSAFDHVGGFPVGVVRFEDWDIWIRIFLKYPIVFTTKICSRYYRNVENSEVNRYLPKEKDMQVVQTLSNAIKNGEIEKKSIPYAIDLITKFSCINALLFLHANKPTDARFWAKKMKSKRCDFRIRKILIIVMSLLPYWITAFIFDKFSNMKSGYVDGDQSD